MLILCPNCRHAIRVRDLRPGRFTPKCPRCERAFELTIPDQKGKAPIVGTVEPSVFAQPVPTDLETSPPAEVPPISWPVGPETSRAPRKWPGPLPHGTPRVLGEHLLLRLLGHGPRGRAFLARPFSMGSLEVLKQVASDRAADPIFLSHLVREAFAASQIEHPNLTGLTSIGEWRGLHFSIAPFIPGGSLAEILEEQASLEPYLATVLILQAARGLAAAHAQGLLHRDVKPQNLRLSPDGLVKVDDLGLEMTPSLAAAIESQEAREESPRRKELPATLPALVGTPSFMAPEQSRDASKIDGRADVYAIGATYYTLVTGRLPFEGNDAAELIRKHQEEDPIPAESLSRGLPRPIADAIRAMMGKHLDERYPNMRVVIEVLERILEVRSEGVAAMLAEAEPTFRSAAELLHDSPARQVRIRILALCGLIGLACSGLMMMLGLRWPSLGILAFGSLTAAGIALSSGMLHRSRLLRLTAALALGGPVAWLTWLAILAVAVALLWSWGGFLGWFMLACAAGLTIAYHVFLDRPWAELRRQATDPARDWVKRLRVRGCDEATIRELAASCAGPRSDELCEQLFGSTRVTSSRRLTSSSRRAPWKVLAEKVNGRLEQSLQDRLDRRHQRVLERVEESRLEAGGLNLLTARRRARRIAKAVLISAREWRDEQRLLRDEPGASVETRGPTVTEHIRRAVRQPEPTLEPHEPQRGALSRRLDSLGSFVFGRTVRFALSMVLLAAFAYWLDLKGIVTFQQVRSEISDVSGVMLRAIRAGDPEVLRDLRTTLAPDWSRLRDPFLIPGSTEMLGADVPGSSIGLAGAVLFVSLYSGRWVTGFLALSAAAVAIFGPGWGLSLTSLADRAAPASQAQILCLLLLAVGILWPRPRASAAG